MVHSGQLKSWFIAYLDEFEKWPILDPIGQINLPKEILVSKGFNTPSHTAMGFEGDSIGTGHFSLCALSLPRRMICALSMPLHAASPLSPQR